MSGDEDRVSAVEAHLQDLHQKVLRLNSDIDIAMNYLQAIALQLLGEERLAELHLRAEERRREREEQR